MMEPYNIHAAANREGIWTEAIVSIAVSLKRIADVLTERTPPPPPRATELMLSRALEAMMDVTPAPQGAYARCIGPWPKCGHEDGECSASPSVQRWIILTNALGERANANTVSGRLGT